MKRGVLRAARPVPFFKVSSPGTLNLSFRVTIVNSKINTFPVPSGSQLDVSLGKSS